MNGTIVAVKALTKEWKLDAEVSELTFLVGICRFDTGTVPIY